jgi:MoxR-like ATPase
VMSRVPDITADLADDVVRTVRAMRTLDLRKAPSVAETIDWARALRAIGAPELTDTFARGTLGVVLKHEHDRAKAREHLRLEPNS